MNLFDAMGLADKERIHSQFLFWFFRLEKNIVSDMMKYLMSYVLNIPKSSNVKKL